MLARVKSICLHSVTVAWSYCIAFAGATMSLLDEITDALGDPSIKDQINTAIGDPTTTGRILLGISIVTIIARLRTLRRTS